MRRCTSCGHDNLPSFPTCSRCGAPLAGVPNDRPQDDYARLMADRAAAQKRKRTIFGVVVVLALGVAGYKVIQDRTRKAGAQAKLDYADKWAETDKRETGAVWACVMASEVNVDNFANSSQVQQRLESAYATQPKTFSDHLLTECVPKIERAKDAFNAADAPAELAAVIAAYRATLPKIQSGIEAYAENIKKRGSVKDVDQLIQDAGNAWQSSTAPTPESIAFEKFLHCAIPSLDQLKDAQGLLQFLADQCFTKNAVAFMDGVRAKCGPLLSSLDPGAKPSATYKVTMKKFYEEDARQLHAWEDCGRRSRKGKKSDDTSELLAAFTDYMEARTNVVKTAKDIAASAK